LNVRKEEAWRSENFQFQSIPADGKIKARGKMFKGPITMKIH
jgi:hypothetical protein